jgi:hypothetical protein
MAGDGIDIDMAAVKALAQDLGGVGARVRPAVKAVITKGALNIKNAARDAILADTRHVFVKQYPYSISYDVSVGGAATVSAEIGPDVTKAQGYLGNLLEFGSSKNAPIPHLVPAWDAEIDNTETWLAKAVEDAVFGAGG